MEIEKKVLDSGKIKLCRYTPIDEMLSFHIRYIVSDIYNLMEFNSDIIWIVSIRSNEGYTSEDVINEYISKYVSEDNIVLTEAGTLTSAILNAKNNASEGLKAISLERELLFNCKFINILFYRRMYRCYGNPNVFIYSNTVGNKFVEDYTGKFISRSSSKD
jgi:hypothetical protein